MPVPLRSTVNNVCGARKVAFLAIEQSKDGKATEGELDICFKNRANKLLVNLPTGQARLRESSRNVRKIKMEP